MTELQSALTAARSATGHSVSMAELLSENREGPVAMVRQATFWLLRNQTGWSYPRIGKAMDRDHTTVMHGVRRTADRAIRDADFAERLASALDEIEKPNLNPAVRSYDEMEERRAR